MGRVLLSCSFLLKRFTNSLWLSSRLKVRLKLVSNTWWTPAIIMTIFSDFVCLNQPFIYISSFSLSCVGLEKNIIVSLTNAFKERSKPPACLSTAEVKVCSDGGSGLRWNGHHHDLLLFSVGLWRVLYIPWKQQLSHSKGCNGKVTGHILHKHSNTSVHLYLVVVKHFEELLVALLCDEDALSWSDAAAAGQTVFQCDLCFLQLLFPSILQTWG